MTVWAVIAHYGDTQTTWAALASLRAGTVVPDRVLVVDNQGDYEPAPRPATGVAGSFGRAGAAQAPGPAAEEVFRPPANTGFAGAAAEGVSRAVDAGASWLWLVNNDAVVAPDCLEQLLAAGVALPRSGLLGPVIKYAGSGRYTDGTEVWFSGGLVNERSMSIVQQTATDAVRSSGGRLASGGPGASGGRLASHGPGASGGPGSRGDVLLPHATGYVSGCVILARLEAVAECGPPDAGLFMYYEDVDWSLRMRRGGWDCVVVPAAVAWHHVHRDGRRRRYSALGIYYCSRNRVLVASRYGSTMRGAAGAAWWGGKQIVKAARRGEGCTAARAASGGLADGLRGRRGRAETGAATPARGRS